MRAVTLACLVGGVVPLFAHLKGAPREAWREFLLKDGHEDLSSQQVREVLMFQVSKHQYRR
jgi:hypothetical protein